MPYEYTDNYFFNTLVQSIHQYYQLQSPLPPNKAYAFLDESGLYLQLDEAHHGASLSAVIGKLDQCQYHNLLAALQINAEILVQGYGLTISVDQRSLLLLQHINKQALSDYHPENWLFPFLIQARLLKQQWMPTLA